VRTFYATLDTADLDALAAAYAALERAADEMLERAQIPTERRAITRAADLRYTRQAYELTVALAPVGLDRNVLSRLAADFHERHRATYGHANPEEAVQLVNIRVTAVGRLDRLDLTRAAGSSSRAKSTSRPVHFRETGLVPCDVVERESLGPGSERPGPVIVESPDSTVVVPPDWRFRVDDRGFILLEARPHA
jgi:N-methylhydantoinase A